MLIEKIESANTITDFSEFERDTSKLWRDPKKYHESDTQRSCSSRRKTPKICRDDTDEKKSNEHS